MISDGSDPRSPSSSRRQPFPARPAGAAGNGWTEPGAVRPLTPPRGRAALPPRGAPVRSSGGEQATRRHTQPTPARAAARRVTDQRASEQRPSDQRASEQRTSRTAERSLAEAETVVLQQPTRSRSYDYYAQREPVPAATFATDAAPTVLTAPVAAGPPGPPPDPPGEEGFDDGFGDPPAPRSGPGVLGVLGELVLTLGVIVLLFVVYEVYWTDVIAAGRQHQATSALDKEWQQGDDPLTNGRTNHLNLEGQGFAKIFVPTFGPDFVFTILQGTDDTTLESGPGHYTDTAMPGQPGNFAVAGHRVGKGSPFNDLGLLNSCDSVVVETAHNWFVYRVLPMSGESAGWAAGKGAADPHCRGVAPLAGPYSKTVGREIVLPTDGDVILPVPNRPDLGSGLPASPKSLITLTTCHPQFSSKQRMVLHGVLVQTYPNDPTHPTAPPELTETQ